MTMWDWAWFFGTPKGAFTRNKIRGFWEEEHVKNGYFLVCTPHIAREEQ